MIVAFRSAKGRPQAARTMSFIVLGTDTDAGKTTFALLWLAAHPEYAYWKPLETGESDTEKVRSLVPGMIVFEPIARFSDPVAPPLAARREGMSIPSVTQVIASVPTHRHLLIETFGGPFSPLNESELQIELIQRFGLPAILVSSSTVGAIGRTLAMIEALRVCGIELAQIVLIGDMDEYACEQIEKHSGIGVVACRRPSEWTVEGIRNAAIDLVQCDLPGARSASKESGTSGTRSANKGIRDSLACAAGSSTSDSLACAAGSSTSDSLACAAGSQALALDRQFVWHPYTSLQSPDAPLPVVGARDEFLHLADGRKIIDGISSWWTILHGHRDSRLMAALREAMRSFDHVLFAGVTHPFAVQVAELLLKSVPMSGGRVFFSDNGSTAVEVALKMAYQFWQQRGEPQRTLFVGFESGYHGDTFGAMAVGRDPLFFGRFERLLFQVERVPVDANQLDDVLKRNAGKVAAVIIEPLVQGAGGMRIHSADELRAIYEATKRHNVLFIADEVMTGCHRTGTMWAHQAAGIAPDLLCAAKTLAGGILPLAATLVSPEVVAAFDDADPAHTFFHGHSFTAHPLACAIAAANLAWLQREPPTAPARFEAFWNEALSPLRDLPLVKDLRIRGTIAAIELDAAGGYLADVGRAMRLRCLEQGVLLRPLGNVLYALPPFGTSHDSLRRIAEAMRCAVETVRLQ
jgi:adenosylmethionine---8-amino-7-oxononanoate aminotransferase